MPDSRDAITPRVSGFAGAWRMAKAFENARRAAQIGSVPGARAALIRGISPFGITALAERAPAIGAAIELGKAFGEIGTPRSTADVDEDANRGDALKKRSVLYQAGNLLLNPTGAFRAYGSSNERKERAAFDREHDTAKWQEVAAELAKKNGLHNYHSDPTPEAHNKWAAANHGNIDEDGFLKQEAFTAADFVRSFRHQRRNLVSK